MSLLLSKVAPVWEINSYYYEFGDKFNQLSQIKKEDDRLTTHKA